MYWTTHVKNLISKAQYTPPTRLNCRVKSRRRCVLNSQLVHDGFGGKKLKAEHVENLSSRVVCKIGNWVTTADGWVHTARHNSTPLNTFSFPFFYEIRRQSSWATYSCDLNTHRATPMRFNSTAESRRRQRCVLGLKTVIRVGTRVPFRIHETAYFSAAVLYGEM